MNHPLKKWWIPLCVLVPFAVTSSALADDAGTELKPLSTQPTIEKLEPGLGSAAHEGQVVTYRYRCWNAEEGEMLAPPPRTLTHLYGTDKMIPGWLQGVETMELGEKRRVTVPPGLAYGEAGLQPSIAPNTTLIFEVELLDINESKTST